MSGSHSTLTDRTPSILNKDQPPDRKPKNEKSPVSLKHEFDPTGLVQRCVIIQRDENGFGLTVSGDNPVFVQLVKEDGAAMRAGVQTGDRIIKVNGTLVTQSNHIEVVKLIKSGSYVALTVLGRPPGLSQIPLEEEEEEEEKKKKEEEEKDEGKEEVQKQGPEEAPGEPGWPSNSPTQPGNGEPQPVPFGSTSSIPQENMASPVLLRAGAALQGEAEEVEAGPTRRNRSPHSEPSMPGSPLPDCPTQSETPCHSPKTSPRDGLKLRLSPQTDDLDPGSQCFVAIPLSKPKPQIIGAEDDYFDTQREQMTSQCSCFQSLESLKCRPAHLAAFLHHVVSQFDPAPLLCYLHADLHKQTNPKESRRLFTEFHSLFMDRAANLKVPVPESVAVELERRKLELIPEEMCKQYSQLLQESLLPDIQKNLEDFRQKRSMGLTLAEEELCRLDVARDRGHLGPDKECLCAEHIVSKIEDILLTSQPTEEEKCSTMQYVIVTYMKHLGVKVKEPRSLEPKRARINFLPKIKKSIKPEKEGEEKVKKPRFPNILGQPRWPSRVDSTSITKALELNKQRSPKQHPHQDAAVPDPVDLTATATTSSSSSSSSCARTGGSQSSDSSDMGIHVSPLATSPPHSAAASHVSNNSGQDSDSGLTPSSTSSRQNEIIHSGENQDGLPTPGTASTHFDFSPSTLDQLPEEEQEMNRVEGLGSPSEVLGEEERGAEGPARCHEDPLNWQRLVSREVLAGLAPQEIKRQEVLNELLYTERAHLRMLKVLDCVFYQRLSKDGILPLEDIRHIFANLEEILQLHGSITEQMATIRNNSETSVIGNIGDDLLAWFGGEEEEKFKRAVGTFCSNQPSALELIKTRQKKEQRFTSFMQEAESNRLCRRLQLKDIIPVEMQRLTKYPLLLENIAKYTEDAEERDKVKQAAECCRQILNYVNQAVKEAENKQRLEDYQRRLDLSSLKQSENPMILEFKNLDLTKGKMVHEGPLSWKVNKDKTIELYTILLEDVLVLLQKQDERLVLKCHSKNLAGTADTKHIFSPIIKLNAVLVRSVATDNKSFFVISMSDNGAQIYELMAQTVSEQRTWQRLVTQCAEAMKVRLRSVRPLAQTDTERDTIEIINTGMSNPSGDLHCTSTGITRSPDKDNPSPPSLGALPTTSTNPFEGLESDDEGEGLAVTDRVEEEEEEEEADEDELEAFLDGELADRLPLLRERSRQGFAINSQEHAAFSLPSSRADEALQTLATLKQVLLEHMTNREQEAELEKKGPPSPLCSRERAPRASSTGSSENTVGRARGEEPRAGSAELGAAERSGEKGWDLEHPPGPLELFETPKSNGRYVVLDSCVGGSESSTDDDGGGGGVGGRGPAEDMEMDPEIDLTKLLSSSSQTGGNSGDGGGPNLSRQLMTHLRLLQASLQHLKIGFTDELESLHLKATGVRFPPLDVS